MSPEYTITVTKIASLFTLVERSGIDVATLFQGTGISPEVIEFPDNRLTTEQVIRLIRNAERLTGNSFIGLHQGESFTTLSNILGYVMMNCSDLGEALNKYHRYQRLVDETVNTELVVRENTAEMIYRASEKKYDTDVHMMDFRLSGCYMFFKYLTGTDIQLECVCFRHTEPDDISEYQRIFKCELAFEQDRNAFVFNKKVLELPIVQPNSKLLEVFENHARQILDNYLSSETFINQVAHLIVQSFDGVGISVEEAAGKLGMSVRTLQNKLKEEGTSFSELNDSIKKDMA